MVVMLIRLLGLVAVAVDQDVVPALREGTWLIGSPAEDLESKIREGLAKKVDPARILEVVRNRRDSFRALADSLEKELRESGKGALEGGARSGIVLEMHRATDLGLARAPVLEILREALRARAGARADVELLSSVIRFAGVAGGSGMTAEPVVRIARGGLARGYSARDFRLLCRRILELRERHGNRYPAQEVGRWMEEGIGRFPTCWEMLDSPPPSPPPAPQQPH